MQNAMIFVNDNDSFIHIWYRYILVDTLKYIWLTTTLNNFQYLK